MKIDLKFLVLGLVDSDFYGFKIFLVYMFGFKNMFYDSFNLIIFDIKWFGVWFSDLNKYKIFEQCCLFMLDQDIKIGKDMFEEDFIKKDKNWVKELELMVKIKEKVEI